MIWAHAERLPHAGVGQTAPAAGLPLCADAWKGSSAAGVRLSGG